MGGFGCGCLPNILINVSFIHIEFEPPTPGISPSQAIPGSSSYNRSGPAPRLLNFKVEYRDRSTNVVLHDSENVGKLSTYPCPIFLFLILIISFWKGKTPSEEMPNTSGYQRLGPTPTPRLIHFSVEYRDKFTEIKLHDTETVGESWHGKNDSIFA